MHAVETCKIYRTLYIYIHVDCERKAKGSKEEREENTKACMVQYNVENTCIYHENPRKGLYTYIHIHRNITIGGFKRGQRVFANREREREREKEKDRENESYRYGYSNNEGSGPGFGIGTSAENAAPRETERERERERENTRRRERRGQGIIGQTCGGLLSLSLSLTLSFCLSLLYRSMLLSGGPLHSCVPELTRMPEGTHYTQFLLLQSFDIYRYREIFIHIYRPGVCVYTR